MGIAYVLPCFDQRNHPYSAFEGLFGPPSLPKIIGKNIDLNVLKRGKTTKNTFATTMERRNALVLH
jgi:hypothetical protein